MGPVTAGLIAQRQDDRPMADDAKVRRNPETTTADFVG